MKTKWLLGSFLFVFTFAADGHSGRLDKRAVITVVKNLKRKVYVLVITIIEVVISLIVTVV